ncbi:Hypothetical predicted protein [Cloeon dipterum]|nr:Hypothetical predicted protein [Cloeon dipterum]
MIAVIALVAVLLAAPQASRALPEPGKWDFVPDKNQTYMASKSLVNGSQIFIRLTCEVQLKVNVTWTLLETACLHDFQTSDSSNSPSSGRSHTSGITEKWKEYDCNGLLILDEYNHKQNASGSIPGLSKNDPSVKHLDKLDNSKVKDNPIVTMPRDGIYVLIVSVQSNDNSKIIVHIDMQSKHGYLSAVDWPLLPFYGAMCLVYVVYGIAWLVVSFCQWRDLLRIQFWIGGVILLGMLEKAVFYAEYQSINSSGTPVQGAVLMAELVSCAKRTLARMLVIIVSLGFGIVKPRLGPMLHRVVGVGLLYFGLAAVECYLRITNHKSQNNQILVASVPLAVLDSAICWWIFTSLVQTTRTLRLRRNVVKLTLYRHFTNTLIFAVIASAIFMLYSIKSRLVLCQYNWKNLWIDEAYWHLLFSTLLLVIMVLWRPTNNNQRYAFTPLLDNPEDDEEDEQVVHDAYGVKMRAYKDRANSPKPRPSTSVEDDLKWVEENIPSSIADS